MKSSPETIEWLKWKSDWAKLYNMYCQRIKHAKRQYAYFSCYLMTCPLDLREVTCIDLKIIGQSLQNLRVQMMYIHELRAQKEIAHLVVKRNKVFQRI